jgi:hypothetical protein
LFRFMLTGSFLGCRVPAFSIRAREALSQYIAGPPLSLKKMRIEENVQLPRSDNCLAD